MTDSDLIHKMVYYALIEMRHCGHESKDKAVYSLANLFHSIVLQMGRASRDEVSYEEVLESLKSKASETGCSRWLEDRIRQAESSADRASESID